MKKKKKSFKRIRQRSEENWEQQPGAGGGEKKKKYHSIFIKYMLLSSFSYLRQTVNTSVRLFIARYSGGTPYFLGFFFFGFFYIVFLWPTDTMNFILRARWCILYYYKKAYVYRYRIFDFQQCEFILFNASSSGCGRITRAVTTISRTV